MARMFGTNGVRGVVNKDMTVQLAMQMGKAVGTVFPGTAAVAMDTRTSGTMLKNALCAGLMSVGSSVSFLGVVPTPALQHYVKSHGWVSCGVMITASHNPPEFNGIKLVAPDGTEASRAQEELIEAKYAERIPAVDGASVGWYSESPGADQAYVDAIVSKVDAEAIRKAGLTVVLDCSNGASFRTSPMLLSRLGVRAITLNGNPQGEFPGHYSEPTAENLRDLASLVRETGADLGIAHDGDADRCVFVDGRGGYVEGDLSLAVLAKWVVAARGGGEVVTPVATSSVVQAAVEKAGGTVVYTAVGSPTVARRMMAGGAVFGGEGNGGLIFPDFQYCRDGAMSAAMMLECVAKAGPLADQIRSLPVYFTEKRKVACPDAVKEGVIRFVDTSTEGAVKDRTDGLKITSAMGWVLLRPSGTEPIFRIIAESRDEEDAKELADKYQTMVEGLIASLAIGS